MVEAVVEKCTVRIRAYNAERADNEFMKKMEELAHELSIAFEKSLADALYTEIAPMAPCRKVEVHNMMLGINDNDIVANWDISAAADMEAAAKFVADNMLVQVTPPAEMGEA